MKRNVLCEFPRDRRRISICCCLPCIFKNFNNREKYIKPSFFKFIVLTPIWFFLVFGFYIGKKIYTLPRRAEDLLILKLNSKTEIGNFLGGIKKKKAASNYILFLKSHFFVPLKYMEKAAKKFVTLCAIILNPSWSLILFTHRGIIHLWTLLTIYGEIFGMINVKKKCNNEE